ncbi:hypothetical protein CSA37_00300 [Candidatus Fermentibacteria bacterium]|nr:MAG: hypothetical protein CSA37_00300 [Candidatus Fermentibacteria bacterium]
MAADGAGNNEIARALGVHPGAVSKWRVRFFKNSMNQTPVREQCRG